MERNQMDRMEEMLASIISMVGNMNEKLQSMDQEIHFIREDISSVKGETTDIKNTLADMQADQDHIWENAAKNERELAKFKRHLQV
ncbi:hypothetical protein QNH39_23530 [Neobacillus novalis]|uniref:Uncharacterized protein n=2 Tax=Neobacillus novalis TaxID=220687 RepID=A0AA95MLU9_9BACI|nr:hypothetical protein [Neobacillus novalis]WHY85547.1 hypothetical protein QNH39_23530 [Neobacillus novalis]